MRHADIAQVAAAADDPGAREQRRNKPEPHQIIGVLVDRTRHFRRTFGQRGRQLPGLGASKVGVPFGNLCPAFVVRGEFACGPLDTAQLAKARDLRMAGANLFDQRRARPRQPDDKHRQLARVTPAVGILCIFARQRAVDQIDLRCKFFAEEAFACRVACASLNGIGLGEAREGGVIVAGAVEQLAVCEGRL